MAKRASKSKCLWVGSWFHSDRLGRVRVVEVRPANTVDVYSPRTKSYYRVSGVATCR